MNNYIQYSEETTCSLYRGLKWGESGCNQPCPFCPYTLPGTLLLLAPAPSRSLSPPNWILADTIKSKHN